MKGKRIVAYIIDVFIIAMITSVFSMLPVFKEARDASEDYASFALDTISSAGSGEVNEEEIRDKGYENEKKMITVTILEFGVTIAYFGILGFALKGETPGKKIMKIKIVHNEDGKDINPGMYMLREVIKTNSLFTLITLIALSVCSQSIYLNVNSIMSYAENVVLLLIIGTMIFRDDERGLHDVICKTKVISTDSSK